MIRKIVAIVLGLIAGSIFNMALIQLSHAMYPFPEGVDPNNFEALKAHIKANGMPTGAMLLVLAAHAGGSLVSGLVCGLIAMRPWYLAATILGLVWTLAGVAMLLMIPTPIWFAVADTVLYVPAALLGVKLGGGIMGRSESSVSAQQATVA